jgi:hypothetical protein
MTPHNEHLNDSIVEDSGRLQPIFAKDEQVEPTPGFFDYIQSLGIKVTVDAEERKITAQSKEEFNQYSNLILNDSQI